ncbi:OmpA family protein [Anaplasma platys]|uniref:OmpA family protein n=1 Tax=Anaplasma platys TaxID=949 RepID=A0A858PXT8_9RICK|nr:OmpA family protein [Anaplasma platys]QJC27395.1 OmpA family protein [Anaplasma platys]
MLPRGFFSLLWVFLALTSSSCFFTKIGSPSYSGKTLYTGENAGAHFANKVEKVYFDAGECKLRESSKRVLLGLIEKVKKRKGVRLTIIGHADSSGEEECNIALGKKRADAVKQFIVEHDKSLASRITTHTKGRSEPEVLVYSKDEREIEKAYTQNRRVVIIVEFANSPEKSPRLRKAS